MAKKRKLTEKQKAFVQEYPKDLNATQAVLRAKYDTKNPDDIGAQLLSNPHVRAEVDKRLEASAEKADITVQRILRELCYIAFGDIAQTMTWTDTGVAFIDSNKLPENITRAISEVNETVTAVGGTRRLKMHDKMRALELLGKYVGMFKEQVEVTNKPFHSQIIEMIEAKKRSNAK